MGAGAASTQLIFFISAILVSSVVVGVATSSVFDLTSGIDDRSNTVKNQLTTDIEIINDQGAVPNNPVLVYVKNIGSTTLNQELITVMLDGTVVANRTLSLTGSGSAYWESSSVLTVSITQTLSAGDHTVTVTTENAISDRLDFRIA